MHPDKVLKAAGVDPNEIPLKEKEKLDRRNKRMFITRNPKKLAIIQTLQKEKDIDMVDVQLSNSKDDESYLPRG